nr:extracellular protopectinase SE3, PPase SE3=endo-polygalacturonase {N-terminal} [Trichosporon penicillatum, B2, Peptide Partial, 17 aa] [Dipodascus klebahnii]
GSACVFKDAKSAIAGKK